MGTLRVAIVGAGVIGCATAFELQSRGVHVVLFDRRGPGGGATQASAGILAPYIEGHHDHELLALAIRSLEAYESFVAHLRASTDLAFEYRRDGTIEVADSAERVESLKRRTASQQGRVECRWLDAAQLQMLEPAIDTRHAGGLYCPTQGFVAVMPFVAALLDAAERRGAVFQLDAVQRILCGERVCSVVTSDGSEDFDAVLLCTGSWAPELDPLNELAGRIKPIKGQLLSLGRNGPPIRRVIWGRSCYVVPWENSTMLVGATSEDVGFDERPTAAGVQTLLASVADLIPTARDATFLGVRVGLRPAGPGGMPILGPSAADPRVVYALGHFRNGVLLAPLTAQLLADYLTSGQQDPVFRGPNGA